MCKEIPNETTADYLHRAIKAVLWTVPIAGPSLGELFDATVASPLSRARDEFLKSLFLQIQELRIDLEMLRTNESFAPTVLAATTLALQQRHESVRSALRNATINTALNVDIPAEHQTMFLYWLDGMTPTQMTLLRFLQDPKPYFDDYHRYHESAFSDTHSYPYDTKRSLLDVFQNATDLEPGFIEQSARMLASKSIIPDDVLAWYVDGCVNASYGDRRKGREVDGAYTLLDELAFAFVGFIRAPVVDFAGGGERMANNAMHADRKSAPLRSADSGG